MFWERRQPPIFPPAMDCFAAFSQFRVTALFVFRQRRQVPLRSSGNHAFGGEVIPVFTPEHIDVRVVCGQQWESEFHHHFNEYETIASCGVDERTKRPRDRTIRYTIIFRCSHAYKQQHSTHCPFLHVVGEMQAQAYNKLSNSRFYVFEYARSNRFWST